MSASLPSIPAAVVLPATSAGAAGGGPGEGGEAGGGADGDGVRDRGEPGVGSGGQAARVVKTRAAEGADPGSSPWVIHVAAGGPAGMGAGVFGLGRRLVTKSLPGPVAFEIKLGSAEKAARERLGAAAEEAVHDGFLTLAPVRSLR